MAMALALAVFTLASLLLFAAAAPALAQTREYPITATFSLPLFPRSLLEIDRSMSPAGMGSCLWPVWNRDVLLSSVWSQYGPDWYYLDTISAGRCDFASQRPS
jgi:hypothetical protein